MASNPFFSGRIPQQLYDAIEVHRQKSGESKTDVLVRALSAYVKAPLENSTIETTRDAKLAFLENRVTRMEQLLEALQPATVLQPLAQELEGQMSINDIEITDNNTDNNTDNILDNTVTKYADNVIQGDKKTDNKVEVREKDDNAFDNSEDNSSSIIKPEEEKVEFWTTTQIQARLGVSRGKLDYWNKVGKLPRTVKEYTIKKSAGKQQAPPYQNMWEVYASPSS